MRTFTMELRKEKRMGIQAKASIASNSNAPCGKSVRPIFVSAKFWVGILGAAYAFAFFLVQKDTLLNLPLAPMDVLRLPLAQFQTAYGKK